MQEVGNQVFSPLLPRRWLTLYLVDSPVQCSNDPAMGEALSTPFPTGKGPYVGPGRREQPRGYGVSEMAADLEGIKC